MAVECTARFLRTDATLERVDFVVTSDAIERAYEAAHACVVGMTSRSELPIFELENAIVSELRARAALDSAGADRLGEIDAGAADVARSRAAGRRRGGHSCSRADWRRACSRRGWRSERSGRLGDEVGYQIRFENVVSKRTRIRFVTEGILLRQLIQDPELRGVSAILFDEFHERHLYGDITLARALRLQETTRPDLKIVVMSATIDAGALEKFLAPCRAAHFERAATSGGDRISGAVGARR